MSSLFTPTITYDPVRDPQGLKANHYQIERSPCDGFIRECLADPNTGFPTPFCHNESIIIAISGAYKSDRYCWPGPRAGYAVFVGPGNPLNIAGAPVAKVPGQWMSFERGELSGAVAALRIVLRILEKAELPGAQLRSVIIKTDSETLARGVTDWIYTWIRKGWVGCGNSRVRDWDLWDELLLLLGQVQGFWGVQVRFWWVPMKWNKEARTEARPGVQIPPPSVLAPCRKFDLEKDSSPDSAEVNFWY